MSGGDVGPLGKDAVDLACDCALECRRMVVQFHARHGKVMYKVYSKGMQRVHSCGSRSDAQRVGHARSR